MANVEKACPIVTRATEQGLEVLAFKHPSAGKQFVKGTIEKGEQPRIAAERELLEESGLVCRSAMEPLGSFPIGRERTLWHFFAWHSSGLPDRWRHTAEDDFGHTFAFFWHPMKLPLDEDWYPIFHEAYHFFAARLPAP
ncbi:NUDIX domain-containing protein [Sinorhizobium numidicum]|uniref:NUDIX domain-containing protein n=1 Tax=Sinorhizobium numidicum TaxID=680248 RepID=A0ABY8CUW2_9HYPH|nr:NUDIX domain-containing protein [Sinorhizobium numidicum]WEX74793.1 NUDIX domain-containing protein [Sinorhizobium numidicum]WEX80786.1 NUDIX domain-containing protein [Sinorhizobium numidicum]